MSTEIIGGIVGVIMILFLIITFIISLAMAIIKIVGVWKVLEKTGKPGWASIIPFYNNWVLFEVSGVNPLFSLFIVGANFLNLISNVISIVARATNEYNYGVALLNIFFSISSIGLSIVAIVFTIIACLNLAKCFKKESIFGIGLAFLGFIFYPLLGFSKAEYHQLERSK